MGINVDFGKEWYKIIEFIQTRKNPRVNIKDNISYRKEEDYLCNAQMQQPENIDIYNKILEETQIWFST